MNRLPNVCIFLIVGWTCSSVQLPAQTSSNIERLQLPFNSVHSVSVHSDKTLFPDQTIGFSAQLVGGFENNAYQSNMNALGLAVGVSYLYQKNQRRGWFVESDILDFRMSFDNDSASVEHSTVNINGYGGPRWYLVSPIKSGSTGDKVERGFSLAGGSLIGLGYTVKTHSEWREAGEDPLRWSDTVTESDIVSILLGGRVQTRLPIIPGYLVIKGFGDVYLDVQVNRTAKTNTLESFTEVLDVEETADWSMAVDMLPNAGAELAIFPSQTIPKLNIALGARYRALQDGNKYILYLMSVTMDPAVLF